MEVLRGGIVQYVCEEYIIASKGKTLFKSNDSGKSWVKWCVLPISFKRTLLSANRWLSRLSRNEVYHLMEINEGEHACFAFNQIYLIKAETGNARLIGSIKGSRPLRVCSDGENIYYGVYTRNTERNSIALYVYSIANDEWSMYHSFTNIRHIHGVFWDKYDAKLWVTTGDLDNESGILIFEDDEPVRVTSCSQQTRAVDLLFTQEAIFYATDAPEDPNYIYRIDRKTNNVEPIQELGGAVFYGRKESDNLFFATVVEPSEVNRTDAVELWGSMDKGHTWKKIKEFDKDIGHVKLFQYGQIKFPYGPGDKENLWFTPYAVDYDHQVVKLSLNSLENK